MRSRHYYIGIVLSLVLMIPVARATLVQNDKAVQDTTEAALRSLSQAYQMSGLREMTENLSKRYLGDALGKKLPEWAGDAIVAAIRERKGPSLREQLNDPKMRAEMKARLSQRLQQEIPKLAKSMVIDKLFNGIIAENDPTANKIIDQLTQAMTTPLNTQADAWAGKLYDKAMDAAGPYLRHEIQIGNSGILLDATDLRGTIDRVVSMEGLETVVSGAMSEALGESAYGEVQRRFGDFMDGNLPTEVTAAIRAGPQKLDAYIKQGKSYLPTEHLKALKAKLMAMPVITIPNEVYGGVLAGSAARHFALAFAEFPAVNAYELQRGGEVTRVLIWQLKTKEGMNLNVGQLLDLATLALNQAGGLGALGQLGHTIQEGKDKLDEIEQQLKKYESKVTGYADKVSKDAWDAVKELEGKLKEYQNYLANYPREWVDGARAGLKEGASQIKGLLPKWFNGVPGSLEVFKKIPGIPDKFFPEWGDKDLLDHTGIRDAAQKINKEASDQLASMLVDSARALLPKSEIKDDEKIPAQNPDENGDYDPVLLHNGEFTHPVVDLTIPGRGLDLQFVRTYRSRSQFVGRLGWNWTHNFEESLQTWQSPGGAGITWVDPSGRKYFFRARPEMLGEFESPSGVFAVLKTIGYGDEKHFELQKPGGMVTRFDRHGFLRETCDRFGNCIRCERDESGVLRAVVDTIERRITFAYDTVGRITQMQDVAGRLWRYQYDAHGDLVTVTAPVTDAYYKGLASPLQHHSCTSGAGPPPHARLARWRIFPEGILTAYYYSSGEADADLNHNMLRIRDPKGTIFLQNTYGKTGFARDQIVAQHYGGPEHRVKSRYVLLRPRWVVAQWRGAKNVAVDRVDLRDRRGVVKRFWHNAAGNLLREDIVDARGKTHPGVQYRYNADGMSVATIKPSGLTLHEDYLQTGNRLMQGRVVQQILGACHPEAEPKDLNSKILRCAQNDKRITEYQYSPHFGDIIFEKTPDGMTRKWQYDSYGSPLTLTLSHGEREIFTRYQANPHGQIIRVTDPRGTVTQFDYDDANRVAVVQDADGRRLITRYAYDTVGNITRITRPNGGVRAFTVDAQNLIRKETTPMGYERLYDYDAHGNVTRMRLMHSSHCEELATKQSSEQSGLLRCARNDIQYRFDYDILDHLSRRIEPVDDTRTATTQYLYDTDGRVLDVQFPEGNRTRYTYDAFGRVTIVKRGAGSRDASFTQYQYDADGNVVGVVDGLGHLTEIECNAFGEAVAVIYPNQSRQEIERDAAGVAVGVTWKDASGVVLSSERVERGVLGLYERQLLWDSRENVWRETQRTWDAMGNLVQVTHPSGAMTRFEYDALGNRRRAIYPENLIESWEYNELGLPARHISPHVGEVGPERARRVEGPGEGAVQFSYDLQGRLTSRTDPNGAVTQLAYDDRDNLVLETPPDGAAIRYDYDGMGRRTMVAWGERVTRYDWDDNGRLRALTDPLGRATRYTYDALDRLLSEALPDGGTTRMQYNANSQVTERCQPNGSCVTQFYDAMGNLLLRRSGAISQSFAFDALGRLVSAQEGDVTAQFSYSSLSQVTESMQGLRRIQLGYDADSHRQKMRFGNGQEVMWKRDALGRATQVEGPNGFRATQIWGTHGPEKIAFANGRRDTMSYDAIGNVMRHNQSTYSYNHLGNLIAQDDIHYGYDAWQQLIQAGAEQWHYNLNGERLGKSDALQWDKNGNLTAAIPSPMPVRRPFGGGEGLPQTGQEGEGEVHYIYDALDRLTEVQNAAGERVARYVYDAFSRRIGKEVGGHRTEYVYDGWEPVEVYEDGKLAQQFVRGDDLDAPFGMIAGDASYYFHRDRLGSVAAVSNGAGTVVEQNQYGPFGEELINATGGARRAPSPGWFAVLTARRPGASFGEPRGLGNRATGPVALTSTRRYTGQIYDPETGLYYMRNRYYSPALGQFLTRDPLGYKNQFHAPSSLVQPFNFSFHQHLGLSPRSSLGNQLGGLIADMGTYHIRRLRHNTHAVETNLHQYANNNPLKFTDPMGLTANAYVNGCDVRIEIPIVYKGDGATPEVIKRINAGIQEYWSGQFGNYNVTTVVVPGSMNPVTIFNRHATTDPDIDRVIAGYVGKWYAIKNDDASAKWVAAHEAGHLMGLDDQYKRKSNGTIEVKEGYENNIMGAYWMRPSANDIAQIIRKNRADLFYGPVGRDKL